MRKNTIVDVYRTGKKMLKDEDINRSSLNNAITVARWMPLIPDLEATGYGSVKLVWQEDKQYMSFDFFGGQVLILKTDIGKFELPIVSVQAHSAQMPLDYLIRLVHQFMVDTGMSIDKAVEPWDEFSGTPIEDIDLDAAIERERNASKVFDEAYKAQQQKKSDNTDVVETSEDNQDEVLRVIDPLEDSGYVTNE